MRSARFACLLVLPLCVCPAGAAHGGGVSPSLRPPLMFEPNVGQTDPRVRFLGRGREYTVFLTAEETVLKLRSGKGRSGATIRMKWVGANPDPPARGLEPLASRINYFVGNDPAGWQTNIPGYARVLYHAVYPGVDVVFRSIENRLEYDLNLAAGVDPGLIRLSVKGATRMRLSAEGDLLLESGGTVLRQPKPAVYQEAGGSRRPLEGRYVILGKRLVGFRVDGRDPGLPLTIDPLLVYSSYLGGSGEDQATGIAVDPQGRAYVTGSTLSANFPATPGAFRTSKAGGSDAFVVKWNASGSAPEYVTYLGGFGDDEAARITVDKMGQAHVVGVTSSQNFPTSPDGYQRSYRGGNTDMFVTKLDAAGSRLAYSTYLGGAGDDGGRDIALDATGKVYVAGYTNSRGYPVTQGVQQTVLAGGQDAVVTKLDPFRQAVLEYSTFLGGTSDDVGTAIKVDAGGLAYVAGSTYSDDFPTTPGVIQPRRNGHDDSFLARLSVGGNTLVFSTYLGGNCEEEPYALALDPEGNAYLTGYVQTRNFPATPGAFQTTHAGDTDDAFVAKVNPTGSRLLYATYLGGRRNDVGSDIAVDELGNAYVLGVTGSEDFPATPAPSQFSPVGGVDTFLVRLNPRGSHVAFSGLIGGTGYDEARGVAIDAAGAVYATGVTSSRDFPTVAGSFQRNYGGGPWDAFVTKFRPPIFTTVSAASFQKGVASAPDSIVAGYGPEMSPVTQAAPGGQSLPNSLAGVTVTVKDSLGAQQEASLFFVSQEQINYLLPLGTANGVATVTVKNGAQVVSYGLLDVESVSPGIFAANFDGRGAPAAIALRVRADGSRSWQYTFQCPPGGGTCLPAAIDMGSESDQIFLELYGTGIRGASSLAAVTAAIGGEGALVEYMGAVPGFFGLDQINMRVPRSLKGRGRVDLVLTVDGKQANTVQLDLR